MDFLTVIEETDKAIKVVSQDDQMCMSRSIEIWLPKAAIEFYNETIGAEVRQYVTIKPWFRKVLKSESKTLTMQVLGLMSK